MYVIFISRRKNKSLMVGGGIILSMSRLMQRNGKKHYWQKGKKLLKRILKLKYY